MTDRLFARLSALVMALLLNCAAIVGVGYLFDGRPHEGASLTSIEALPDGPQPIV